MTINRCLTLIKLFGLSLFIGLMPSVAKAFDHQYAGWANLLQAHVKYNESKTASAVDYASFQQDRQKLQAVLANWSLVSQADFDAMTREQQMAFLINSYNGFTIELILTKYPNLKSIKDLGGLFSSPWKKEFFMLLGKERHLDWIEHEMLRAVYKEPRIHAAVNCASVGCPALHNEPYTAEGLSDQLENAMFRFLSDSSRNRLEDDMLKVSEIFKWFREDFEQNHQGFNSLESVFARYRFALTSKPAELSKLAKRQYDIKFIDYDWSLNDIK